MLGTIRTRDIWAHPLTTIRCFGWTTFFRAVTAGRNETFLSLLGQSRTFSPADSEATVFLGRCIDLELRAERVYLALARDAAASPRVAVFFATLARQEQSHAELLKVCAAAARRHGWNPGYLSPWRDYLPLLEKQMQEAESAVGKSISTDDALRLVVRIESSELNQIFRSVLPATHSTFVRRLRPFREAVASHLNYIVTEIPQLAPNLTMLSRELRTSFAAAP